MQNYKDLEVWQKSMDLTDEVYRLTRSLPKEELYALSSQIRRAAISIPSNIAEGKGRHNDKEMLYFIRVALGSCFEIETQILIGQRQGFWISSETEKALVLCEQVARMLQKLRSVVSCPANS